MRSDHSNGSKKSEVCIYYKQNIPLIKRDDIFTLNNCFVTEIRSQNEKHFLTCIYCSPSQNHDEFQNFCVNFDTLPNNINDKFPILQLS